MVKLDSLLTLRKSERLGVRVSCQEYAPLLGTVVANPKGWVTVDFGDVHATSTASVDASSSYSSVRKTYATTSCFSSSPPPCWINKEGAVCNIAGVIKKFTPTGANSKHTARYKLPTTAKGLTGFDVGVIVSFPSDELGEQTLLLILIFYLLFIYFHFFFLVTREASSSPF